jgi:hypothetical protein
MKMFYECILIRFWGSLQQHTWKNFLRHPVIFSKETHNMHPHETGKEMKYIFTCMDFLVNGPVLTTKIQKSLE